MSHVDYMKVIDIAASSLEPSCSLKVNALDMKLYSAEITLADDSLVKIKIRINEYSLDLTIMKSDLTFKTFSKWIKTFEYNLEQDFYKNIKMTVVQNNNEYQLNVAF